MARSIFLIIDFTPDASYTDKLALAIQHVSGRKACANECLVRVLLGVSNKALGMEEVMGGRRSPRYNCNFYICPVYKKRDSNEFGVCLRSTDSMAVKAVSLHSLLANQSGKIYLQNFEADVFPSGAVDL
ncbi:hypothetical protein TNCV_3095821 [Trichonephila clavipes]|nr:hypothetical protein TNCV_3095821 [Trichonephila clavipes]